MSYTIQDEREYISGEAHFFKGELYRLKVIRDKTCTRHVEIRGDYIIIYVSEHTSKENIANVLWTWYKEQLTPIMERLVDKWEQILGVKAANWTIQQMQSSWGKCHKESGKIMFNLQLAKKPLNCIEYVIAHELTHLIEQNHTDRFLHILGTYLPGWQKINDPLNEFPPSDIWQTIHNYHPLLPDTLAMFKEYLDKYDELTSLKVQIKELTTTLTNKVVEKYAALTEDEIRTLVVERKWLAAVIGGCMALMQSVTHRIGTEVASLVERYENTLPELTKEVREYESEVNGYLAEMGFTL